MTCFHFLTKYTKHGLLRPSRSYFNVSSFRRVKIYQPFFGANNFKKQQYGYNNNILSKKIINETHRNGRMFSNESDQQMNFDDISEGKISFNLKLFFYPHKF